MSSDISRRQFLADAGKGTLGAGMALAATGGLARSVNAQTMRRARGANDRILAGLIGCGGMGRHVMEQLMHQGDVEFIAVCDVDERHLAQAEQMVVDKYGKTPFKSKDFRDILGINDLDIVVIGTPDHWHALPTIYACQAGLDVYLEKPISHNIVEALQMVKAARHYETIIQVGTWQRSTQHFVDALDFVKSGALGQINVCKTWTLGTAGLGNAQPQDPPPELDWDFWLGPAAYLPYQHNRAHYNWRWFFDFAGGLTGDWGVHMIDMVLVGMDVWDPITVSAAGGKLASGEADDRTTPDTISAIVRFPNFLMSWEVYVGEDRAHGVEFIGQNGSLVLNRNGCKVNEHRDRMGGAVPTTVNPLSSNHYRNFLDCVKSREQPRSNIYSMAKTTILCHLTNLAYLTGKTINWDPITGIPNNGDPEVTSCQIYEREYRKPWSLPKFA